MDRSKQTYRLLRNLVAGKTIKYIRGSVLWYRWTISNTIRVLDQQKNGIAPPVFNQITEGQLFFNSTTNAFKETVKDIPGATWASGGNFKFTKRKGRYFWNTNSSFIFGGDTPPGTIRNVEAIRMDLGLKLEI